MSGAADESKEPTRRDWVGFWSMIGQQTQNAFNDKAAQFILIPLGGAVGFAVESSAALMIALPFVLFAPLAGWLSDRFSKRDVMLGAAFAQCLILGWLFGAVAARNMPLALGGFFALAVQSAFFSPAKIGINKELVGSKHLGFAAGIQQMMAMLAILAGQIVAGTLYDQRYGRLGGVPDVAWQAAATPLLVLTSLSLPAILLAWIVPRTPAQSTAPLTLGLVFRHFQHLADLWRRTGLRRASLGVAFFWGFAAFINLWSVKLAKALTGGQEGFGTLASWFMGAASVGMIGGFGAASFLLRRRIELGWVPVAGAAMTVAGLALAAIDPQPALRLVAGGGEAWPSLLRSAGGSLFLWTLAGLAFFAAVFLAPLNAWMQDNYPADKRGELQAAVNLQDCFAGILAAVAIETMTRLAGLAGLDAIAGFRVQIAVAALSCGLITWFILRLLPADFIRVVGLTLLHAIYRIRTSGTSAIPKSGGVLLLPNHITWADAFFLTAACPRPVRFIMEEGFMRHRAVRVFCRIFDTLPISSAKPKDALNAATRALKAGDVVCIFPEGQLTRTGTLRHLKRGFELIARRAECPLIPVWTDGVWGSVFSFEGDRFFRKFPRPLRRGLAVAFGAPLPPESTGPEELRLGLHAASSEALKARLTRRDHPARANALQLSQINGLRRGIAIGALDGDPLPGDIGALDVFSRWFRAPLQRHHSPLDGGEGIWIGGGTLRDAIAGSPPPPSPRVFFDFSERSHEALGAGGWLHCPCLAIRGTVVAMSLPDPPAPYPTSQRQTGTKPGSVGLLLPGFALRKRDGRLAISGPSLEDELLLPAGWTIDDEGFLFPSGEWIGSGAPGDRSAE